MKKKILAKKVDILIPTNNRPHYLKRILKYYHENGKDFNFVVTDSSNTRNKTLNKKIIEEFSTLKITYKDNFSEKLTQSLKFGQTLKYSRSKYCVFCGDDDFIIPDAILESVKFLEENADYVAAHGVYIGFHLFRNRKFAWRFRYQPHTISNSSPIKRLDYHLRNYIHLVWSVRRTDSVKRAYKKLFKANFDPRVLAVMGELLPDSLTVLYGKAKAIPILYGARQYFGSVISYYPTLIDARENNIYDIEYAKYKKSILKALSKNREKENSQIIDKAFDVYNKFSYQEHMMNKINKTLSFFPKFISQSLQLFQTYYLFSKVNKSILGKIDQPSNKYFTYFSSIKKLVLQIP